MNNSAKMPPVHPGEILLEEYLEPMGLSQHRLALCLGVDPRRVNEIVQGKRSITADTALPDDTVGGYTIVGKVTSGLDALVAGVVAAGTADGSGDAAPLTPATITGFTSFMIVVGSV